MTGDRPRMPKMFKIITESDDIVILLQLLINQFQKGGLTGLNRWVS